jgi:hypothetical protein
MMGATNATINNHEFEGEMDRATLEEPVTVKLKFYSWNAADIDHPEPYAFYKITDSNHPMFLVGNVYEKHTLDQCDVKLPKTPIYEKWNGRI